MQPATVPTSCIPSSDSDSVKMPCRFKLEWMKEKEFASWLAPDSDPGRAFCKACRKPFDISSMGASGIRSHMRGEKHRKNIELKHNVVSIADFTRPKTSSSVGNSSNVGASTSIGSGAKVTVTREEALVSEIWYCLHVVNNGYSFKSCEDAAFVMKTMFSDSEIVKQFSCGKTKCSYLSVYGIAPYFKACLLKSLSNDKFVVMFDESPNKKMQSKQMDVLVRYWHGGRVVTRYLNSAFLGKATANDLVKNIRRAVEPLNLSNGIQLSMDGPNVNWSTYDKLGTEMMREHNVKFLNLGSCGLHIIHNAFRHGAEAAGWNVADILSAMYTLFDNVPARREEYENLKGVQDSDTEIYALKWCSHRWLENVSVANRAIEILRPFREFVRAVTAKIVKNPGTKSYDLVKSALSDHLLESKLCVFVSVAKCVEPFLTLYQTDKVMVPFLSADLELLIKKLMKRFLKLGDSVSAYELTKIDVNAKNLDVNKVDVGFIAEERVKALLREKKVSEREVYQMRSECKAFLKKIVERLLLKCPLLYRTVRNLTCLDPKYLVKDPERAKQKFKRVLQVLVECGRVIEGEVDGLLEEFSQFSAACKYKPSFCNFSKQDGHVDVLYYEEIRDEYPLIWAVIRQLLILSHGQAAVERGFSVNKGVSRENQDGETLVKLRLIKDHIASVGGIREMQVSKELVTCCASARMRYNEDLERKRREVEAQTKLNKRKAQLEEIDSIKKKRKVLSDSIELMTKETEDLYEKAVKRSNMAYVVSANAIKNTIKEKKDELVQIESDIKNKEAHFVNV